MIKESLERSFVEVSRLMLEQGCTPGLTIALEMAMAEIGAPMPVPEAAPPVAEPEPAPRPAVRVTNEGGEIRARPNVPEAAGAAQVVDDVLRWHMRKRLHPAAVDLLALVHRVHLLEEALADASRQVMEWEAAAQRNGWSL